MHARSAVHNPPLAHDRVRSGTPAVSVGAAAADDTAFDSLYVREVLRRH